MSPSTLFTCLGALLVLQAGSSLVNAASAPTVSDNIPHLRDLAKPRFFGTALNTTFLFNDANYTLRAGTQVCIDIPNFLCLISNITCFSVLHLHTGERE